MKSKSTASQINTQANIFIHSIQICLIPMLEQINIKAKAIIPTIEKDIAIIFVLKNGLHLLIVIENNS